MATEERTARPKARAFVLRALIESGAVSRAELARRTSLAPSTVSAIVSDLAGEGLVAEPSPSGAGGLGRPATLVALHRRAGTVLGIDFGKRHIRVAVADLAHAILAERRARGRRRPAGEHAIAQAVELADAALAEAGASRSDVVGVGMGLPGPVHETTGELGDSTILPGWVGVRAAEAMHDALGLPVDVGNDANLGALAEWMWGAGSGAEDMAYIKVATGVGCGLVLDGRPFVGAGGTAGELGHTVIDPAGAVCRCGNRGCLETIAGAHAIEDRIAEATPREEAIAEAGTAIGTAVATLCNLVNPRRVVVGGDLAAAGDLLLRPLRAALDTGAIRSAAADVEIVARHAGRAGRGARRDRPRPAPHRAARGLGAAPTASSRAPVRLSTEPRGVCVREDAVHRGARRAAARAGRRRGGEADELRVDVLSNRADLISAGDALVAVDLPGRRRRLDRSASPTTARDVTSAFAMRAERPLRGPRHRPRRRRATCSPRRAPGTTPATASRSRNHPNGGPVFSGPQVKPWVCQEGAVDAQCNQPADATSTSTRRPTARSPRTTPRTRRPTSRRRRPTRARRSRTSSASRPATRTATSTRSPSSTTRRSRGRRGRRRTAGTTSC